MKVLNQGYNIVHSDESVNTFEQLFRRFASVDEMVIGGSRDPEKVGDLFGRMVDGVASKIPGSNDFERLLKLRARITEMAVAGNLDPRKVARMLQFIIQGSCSWDYTAPVFGYDIPPMPSGIVPEATLAKVFADVSPALKRWCSVSTTITKVTLRRIARAGRLRDFFGSRSRVVNRKSLQWSQVVEFCRAETEVILADENKGLSLLFLITQDGLPVQDDFENAVSVVEVYSNGHGLRAGLWKYHSNPYGPEDLIRMLMRE